MSTREQRIAALEKTGPPTPAGRASSAVTPPLTSSVCRATSRSNTSLAQERRQQAVGQGQRRRQKGYVERLRRDHRRPGDAAGQGWPRSRLSVGWQVAADGNTSETMYPDQSLYAYDSVPTMVRRINNTFKRADEIQWSRGINEGDKGFIDYFLPIVGRRGKPVSAAC